MQDIVQSWILVDQIDRALQVMLLRSHFGCDFKALTLQYYLDDKRLR